MAVGWILSKQKKSIINKKGLTLSCQPYLTNLAGLQCFDATEHLAKLRNTNYFTSVLISSSKTIDLSLISSGMRLSPLLMQT